MFWDGWVLDVVRENVVCSQPVGERGASRFVPFHIATQVPQGIGCSEEDIGWIDAVR